VSKLTNLNTRPATHTLTTRVDARYLATLIRYWHKQGLLPRSSSELIRLSIETFTEILTLNNEIGFVDLYTDAVEIIENAGFNVKTNPRNVAKALVADGLSLATPEKVIDQSYQETRKTKPISSLEESAIAEEFKKRLKERDQNLVENIGEPPDSKETSNKE
jgi:hypothetical protein